MISCALCLKDDADSLVPAEAAAVQFIEIFSADGIEFKISYIIEKHLGIFYDAVDDHKAIICLTCWGLLWNFHQYYNRILKVQKLLKAKVTHVVQKMEEEEEDDIDINTDPLPEEEDSSLIKCDKTAKQQKFMVVNEDFFDAGKVEVQDLELLPQIEIIEDNINICGMDFAAQNVAGIKNAMNLTHDDDFEDFDDYHNYNNNEDDDDDKTDLKKEIKNKVLGGEFRADICVSRIRRGRPRKCKNVKTIIDDEGVHEYYKGDDVKSATDEHNKSTVATNDTVVCSSKNNVASDDDSDSDYLDDEGRYAKLDPPRIPNRPKRYRKHEQPRKVVQHMSSEEIAERKKLQAEYERVIKKFFKKFVCPKCDLWVHNFQEMRQHFRTSHSEIPCFMSCCGRKFFQRKSLAEHIHVHWNPEYFKCKTCERILQDGKSLELHERSHVSGSSTDVPTKVKRTFQCDKCPRTFTTKVALEYHIFSKHVPASEFKFSCKECNKKLPTERKLREHMKCTHDPESAIICDKCGKKMRSQTNLKKHHEIEHSQIPRPVPVPQQCEICGSWLRHLSGLKQHVKTMHENSGGIHRCHICNKISTNARALKRHVYHNHECERKFKCTMCEKAFKRPQDLREHISTHTGEVLYTCPNCPMTFFSNANMYKHRQRLHRAEYEADRKKPRPPNIMQQAVVATEAMKKNIK